jgi:hypothetical protein
MSWLAQKTDNIPVWFGWYHLICTAVLIGAIVFVGKFAKRVKSETVNQIVLLSVGAVMAVMEIVKQLLLSYNNGWHYDWGAFPFVPCSAGMFVLIAAGFLRKESRIRNALYWYLATFSMFGGLCIFIWPVSVLSGSGGYIFILGQSMIHHGLLGIAGAYLSASGRVKFASNREDARNFLHAFFILLALCAAAVILMAAGIRDTNLMFVSPYIVGLDAILFTQRLPYLLWLLIFFAMFSACAYLTMWIQKVLLLPKGGQKVRTVPK